uniref:Uncharacterized protein n=1 Tax=Arion vulgaris TaxID=1028688 RepID=A0A0B7BKR7_9EUPU
MTHHLQRVLYAEQTLYLLQQPYGSAEKMLPPVNRMIRSDSNTQSSEHKINNLITSPQRLAQPR